MRMLKIARRFRPYSHLPGTKVLIPGSSVEAQLFPTKCILSTGDSVDLSLEGPVRKFTVMQDLEVYKLSISGFAKEGFFRYEIFHRGSEITFQVRKGEVALPSGKKRITFFQSEEVKFPQTMEKLCFGCHKKQDVDMISKRSQLLEVLPIWFRLSQLYRKADQKGKGGHFSLLETCEDFPENFMQLYRSAFSGIFAPRAVDENYLGMKVPPHIEGSNAQFLSRSYKVIRELFVRYEKGSLSILPKVLKSMPCGRMLSVTEKEFILDFEWSKRRVRKVYLRAREELQLHLCFQNDVKAFRFQRNKTLKNGEKISIRPGKTYFFDHFEK